MKVSEEFMKRDGTYSWFMLVVITLTNFVCMGYLFGSAGVLSEVYPRLLNLDPSITNAIGSALIASFLLSGPFNTMLLAVIGCRAAAALSCLLTLAGVVSLAFSSQLWHFILGYSIVSGTGISMNVISSIAIIPSYFEKRIPAAYASTGLGQGIGLVAFPYILSTLLEKYKFKFAVLLTCPIIALSVIAPIVFIPKPDTLQPRVGALSLIKSYVKPLHSFSSPFYLLNSYLWQGGFGGLLLLLFNFITNHSAVSVAVICYSILGAGFLASSLSLSMFLLKFKLNHYILHIFAHFTAGVAALVICFVSSNNVYFICFAVIGVCHGITISNMVCITAHIYVASQVEYAFGSHQIIGGVGGIVAPLTGGLLQYHFGDLIGLYYIGGHLILAAVALIIPAVVRPQLWKSKQAVESLQSSRSATDGNGLKPEIDENV